MINIIMWVVASLAIYAVLKAFSAKVNGLPFEDGLTNDAGGISEGEAAFVACIAPLGVPFACIAIVYLVLDWEKWGKNPLEIAVQAIAKWVRDFFELAPMTEEEMDEVFPEKDSE